MRKCSATSAASDATSPIMGRKVFLAVACFLTLSKSLADAKGISITLDDSLSEATVPQLYRNIPDAVYASTSPYTAFSFQIPSFASSQRITHIGPIQQASSIVENKHGVLKDSYGNKFLGSPQTAYRTAFPQQYVQLQELPAHLAQPLVSAAPSFQYRQVTPHFFGPPHFKVQALQTASPSTANRYAINQPYSFSDSFRTLASNQHYQYPPSNKADYANSGGAEQQQNQKNVEKSQLVEEIPNSNNKDTKGSAPKATQNGNAQLKSIAASASVNKGQKAVINLVTKPPVPLLDLTLLEPLTFDNPLVPQVQHFLPRIASVTYQKLPELNVKEIKKEMKQIMIQNTKSYDSGVVKGKPNTYASKERHPRPAKEKEETTDENDPPRDVPNGELEILYDNKSPNYQETTEEKILSYNKETETEPVHYSYNEKNDKKPLVYNYVRTSKQPLKVQNVNYVSNDQNPEHHIFNFRPEEVIEHRNAENRSPQQNEREDSSEDSEDEKIRSHERQQNHGRGPEKETPHHPEKLEQREEEHQGDVEFIHHNNRHHSPRESNQAKSEPAENLHADIEPVITEYEEDIRILPTPKQYSTVKVDPNQHIQQGHVSVNNNSQEPQDSSDDSEDDSDDDSPHNSPPHNQPQSDDRPYRPSEEHVQEKSKRIIIKEETPEHGNQNNQKQNVEVAENNDKSEENFEKDYKNAAYGFPSYESNSRDTEKEIYNPETYGKPQYDNDFDVEHIPFQQYQVEGDDYPKSRRSNYKDSRDKTKENYYLDYAISKPKSIQNRFRQKDNYYKAYVKQKPQYLKNEREGDEKESAKYIAAPSYDYHGAAQKPKLYFAKYQAAPSKVFEYDYSKEAPKDNSAQPTLPHQRFKTYTQFVEPQFQYGFDPSGLPRLLDSELAAMASNHNLKSEKPGMRKIYKENLYIKEISTNGRKVAS